MGCFDLECVCFRCRVSKDKTHTHAHLERFDSVSGAMGRIFGRDENTAFKTFLCQSEGNEELLPKSRQTKHNFGARRVIQKDTQKKTTPRNNTIRCWWWVTHRTTTATHTNRITLRGHFTHAPFDTFGFFSFSLLILLPPHSFSPFFFALRTPLQPLPFFSSFFDGGVYAVTP